jgi:aminopeptidase N
MGKRALKNRLMALWMSLGDEVCASLCKRYYDESTSMTDRLAMLDLLENYAPDLATPAFLNFYERHNDNTLVMNKYFTLLASCRREGTLEHVIALQEDKAFDMKVPNLVRSLIGSFARNIVAFHDVSGNGYDFVADKVIEIDEFNPQIASGLAGAFKSYEKLTPIQKGKMGSALERIKNHPSLSNNVSEIISKILNN